MKVRICPLCDSEMKKAHYCDTCHSFVWRPEILDIHYNAQQRERGEKDCAYGAEHDKKDHHDEKGGKFSDRLKKSGRKPQKSSSHEEVYGKSIQKTKADQRRSVTTDADENKRKVGGCLGKIILVIIILNAVLGSVGSHIFDFFTGDDFRYHIENVLDKLGIEDDISIWESGSQADDEICAIMASFRDEERADDFFIAAASALDPGSGYDQGDWENILDDLNNQVMEDYDEQSGFGNGRADSDNMILTSSKFSDGEICLTFEVMDFQ